MPPNEPLTLDPPRVQPLATRVAGDPHRSLVAKLAHKFHVEPEKMIGALKATAFRQREKDPEPTNEQMMALCVVADQYGLNPWTKELYAFPDKGGIVPVVGVDGWSRIVNQHEAFDGVEFSYGPPVEKRKNAPEWIECVIYRKDRAHPTKVREHLAECWRDTGPWQSHPARMLRHKAFMQCARIALGFVGIYDEDEAQRIIDGEAMRVGDAPSTAVDALNAKLRPAQQQDEPAGGGIRDAAQSGVIDVETVEAGGEAPSTPSASAEAKTEPEKAAKPAKPKAKAKAAPSFSYAEVADRIAKATDADQLAEATTLIEAVSDPAHQAELRIIADRRESALMGES